MSVGGANDGLSTTEGQELFGVAIDVAREAGATRAVTIRGAPDAVLKAKEWVLHEFGV